MEHASARAGIEQEIERRRLPRDADFQPDHPGPKGERNLGCCTGGLKTGQEGANEDGKQWGDAHAEAESKTCAIGLRALPLLWKTGLQLNARR